MSMSTHVVGFKPPDETWQKMKKIYDACMDAGVQVPETVLKFFNYGVPSEKGVLVEQHILEKAGVVKGYFGTAPQQGYELNVVELVRLAPDIQVIRFYNSW
jgi:hypothetical protein